MLLQDSGSQAHLRLDAPFPPNSGRPGRPCPSSRAKLGRIRV